MTVVCLSTVPAKLKGFLTKYLWEVNTGVYVGKLSARVRELVWQRIQENKGLGSATMVFPSDNEQGFVFYSTDSQYVPIDYDGLLLVKHLLVDHQLLLRLLLCLHHLRRLVFGFPMF